MKIRKWMAVLLTVGLLMGLLPVQSALAADMPQDVQQQFAKATYTDPDTGLTLPYRIYVPEKMNSERKYSLLLFLHGAGQRGTDNQWQIIVNAEILTRIVNSTDPDQSCIIIAPQCPNDKQWVDTPWGNGSYSVDAIPQSQPMAAAMKLVDQIAGEYRVDTNRMYIAGISMGGYGTWDTIMRFPDKFAAAIPICGAADPSKASLIKDLPIRTYHSTDDLIVPVRGTQDMVAALKAAGSNVIYTEYTNAGHEAWKPAFDEPDLLDWLFAQRRASPVSRVDDPANISVPQGTEFAQLSLPKTVKVTLADGRTQSVAVQWESEGPDGKEYDGYTSGEYILKGLLPDTLFNPDGLFARITVTVEAPLPTVIPGDLDKDEEVTIADVMEACKVMARESAGTDPTDEEIQRGDLDDDGEITIADVMEICKILARQG